MIHLKLKIMKRKITGLLMIVLFATTTLMAQNDYQRTTKTLKSFDWLKAPVVENVDVFGGLHIVTTWNTDVATSLQGYVTAHPNVIAVGTLIAVPVSDRSTKKITFKVTAYDKNVAVSGTNPTYEIAEEVSTWAVGITYQKGQTILFGARLYIALTDHTAIADGTTPTAPANHAPRYDDGTNTVDNRINWRPAAAKLFPSAANMAGLGATQLTDANSNTYPNAGIYEGDMVVVNDNGTGNDELFVCISSDMAGAVQWYGTKSGLGSGSGGALPTMKHYEVADVTEAVVTADATFSGATTTLALSTDANMLVNMVQVVAYPVSWGRKDIFVQNNRLFDGLNKYVKAIDHDNSTTTPDINYQFWVCTFNVPTGTTPVPTLQVR
jgi:hypothetical protein